ncbi:endonuclease domain-containing protein [Sandarakinorhabdus sp.]|uniref:endonuclease domain-containing protein n=1 Tax=Sandarakinorhabdus sp. TaxID=1916663 RepID=UPI003F722326
MPNVPRPTRDLARTLRRQMTLPEVMLWQHLRGSPAGLRFRRQHPVGRYVLDFYCSSRALAVEVDGYVHQLAAQTSHDEVRDAWLADQGVTIMRIPATDVLRDVDAVVGAVLATARSLSVR